MKPELIADYDCVVGEGPLWHPLEKKLYWVDIGSGRMFRYDPAKDAHEQIYDGEAIGGFTIQADGNLLLFMDKGAIKVWHDGFKETIHENLPNELDSRFNDVIADPMGRVFCGTMPGEGGRLGRLYRLNTNGRITKLLDGIECANGMGFSLNRQKMYFTDSGAKTIYAFDYDKETGELDNQRDYIVTKDEEGVPDGMTVDADGNIWSARWDGNCLTQYDRRGNEKHRIEFPAKKVSSVTFGGEDYRDMYVTTAGGDKKEEEGKGAGALFRLRVTGVQGIPEYPSKVGL